jgi:hypothetical protein
VLTITGVKSTLTNCDAFAGFYGVDGKLDELKLTLGSSCSSGRWSRGNVLLVSGVALTVTTRRTH